MKLILSIVFSLQSASICFACTWIRGNSCYTLVRGEFKFLEAETYCRENFNGHLLAINSMEEDDFIRARLLDEHRSSGWWWIGLTKAEGDWKWTTGEEISYSNWESGEPSGEREAGGIHYKWLKWDDLHQTGYMLVFVNQMLRTSLDFNYVKPCLDLIQL